jgi:hypothetical protein
MVEGLDKILCDMGALWPCSLGLSAILFQRRNNVFLSRQISEQYFFWQYNIALKTTYLGPMLAAH